MDERFIEQAITNPKWPFNRCNLPAHDLIPMIQNLGSEIRCIEIGVDLGFNSYMLLETCLNIIELVGIDPYTAYQDWDRFVDQTEIDTKWNEITSKNIEFLGPKFKFLKTTSTLAAKNLNNNAYNFIFLDGDHSSHGVYCDLNNYWPKLRSGGIIAGHDVNLNSVKYSVREWTRYKKLKVTVVDNQSWWCTKP
jgi:predicted O-methyltransferase YrrM